MDNLGIAMILGMMSGDARRRENEERIRRGQPPLTDPVGDLIGSIFKAVFFIVGWGVGILIVVLSINALWTYYRPVLFLVGAAALSILGSKLEKRKRAQKQS